MVVVKGKRFTTYPRPGALTGDEEILMSQEATSPSQPGQGPDGKITHTALVWDIAQYVQNQTTSVVYTPSGFYDIAGAVLGKPHDGATIMRFVAVRPYRIPADFLEAQASTLNAATADATFTVRKNGTSIGTFTFEAGQTFATWDKPAFTDFAIRDVFTVDAPSPQDATLGDIEITIVTYLDDPTVVIP